jgi:hypothetical protein
MSGETGMVAFHWYSRVEITVRLERVAAMVLAAQLPTGPQTTLPMVADRSVAQLIVIEDWMESVR